MNVQSLSLKSGSLIYLRFQKFLAAGTGANAKDADGLLYGL